MEGNVNISLALLDKLRAENKELKEFKESKEFLTWISTSYGVETYSTDSEVLKELVEKYNKLQTEFKTIEWDEYDLKKKLRTAERKIKEAKEMSITQFIKMKWKCKN